MCYCSTFESHCMCPGVNHCMCPSVNHCMCPGVNRCMCPGVNHWMCPSLNHCMCPGVNNCMCPGVNHCICPGLNHWMCPGVNHCMCPGLNQRMCPSVNHCMCPGVNHCICPGVYKSWFIVYNMTLLYKRSYFLQLKNKHTQNLSQVNEITLHTCESEKASRDFLPVVASGVCRIDGIAYIYLPFRCQGIHKLITDTQAGGLDAYNRVEGI